jgi:hypothetical protein|tara:strand:- start:78 stop:254 length:177 start_codon:yes stop_codon:yes gene_type:complete
MTHLAIKIKAYVEAADKTFEFFKDVVVQDDSDGNGAYIKEWNIEGLDKPSDADLAIYE